MKIEWIEKLKARLETTIDLAQGKNNAAVLVPIGNRPDTTFPSILLTKRTDKVETHKGQISFPGGFYEQGDENILKTALREAYEEVGLEENQIQVLGCLKPVKTLGEVVIYPWVAKVDFPETFHLSIEEVEKTLFLPLDRLLREGLELVEVPVKGSGPTLYINSLAMEFEGELVWGASAKILNQLYQALK